MRLIFALQQSDSPYNQQIIALPGAMTGLLLAGIEPMNAVLIQLIVMYMILGSATVTVCILVWFGLKLSFTNDLRLASEK